MAEGGVYVSAALAELLRLYLDERRIAAPAVRAELDAYAGAQRMPVETWWSLLQAIAEADPQPAIGLRIGRFAKPHHVGVLGYLAMSCATLGQALIRFQRFQPLLHNLTPTLATRRGEDFGLSWDPAYGRSTRLSDEVLVSAMLTLARSLTGHAELALRAVEFPGLPPDDPTVHARLLGCPVQFGARTLVVHLPVAALDLPIDSRDPHLMRLLEQQAEALLHVLPQPDALMSGLQRAIVDALQDGEPAFEQIAARLGVPSRSLYRRLQERGLSYKGVLNHMRLRLARTYLADPTLSLPQIALLLGYSEQSAFTRAFKGWCGETPLHYRRQALGAAASA
ncbi:AraC family transcriptional regulator [Solimonas variicoloris]|uniref:AraC family transcriptional regulator n=1 Tax=Solimonas variicoloris TaxID=254408 RepID=UPI00037C9BDD|nr:AraC family transcriptional regulator [Solimonas variicoloris]